jgi:hypothetical protein
MKRKLTARPKPKTRVNLRKKRTVARTKTATPKKKKVAAPKRKATTTPKKKKKQTTVGRAVRKPNPKKRTVRKAVRRTASKPIKKPTASSRASSASGISVQLFPDGDSVVAVVKQVMPSKSVSSMFIQEFDSVLAAVARNLADASLCFLENKRSTKLEAEHLQAVTQVYTPQLKALLAGAAKSPKRATWFTEARLKAVASPRTTFDGARPALSPGFLLALGSVVQEVGRHILESVRKASKEGTLYPRDVQPVAAYDPAVSPVAA